MRTTLTESQDISQTYSISDNQLQARLQIIMEQIHIDHENMKSTYTQIITDLKSQIRNQKQNEKYLESIIHNFKDKCGILQQQIMDKDKTIKELNWKMQQIQGEFKEKIRGFVNGLNLIGQSGTEKQQNMEQKFINITDYYKKSKQCVNNAYVSHVRLKTTGNQQSTENSCNIQPYAYRNRKKPVKYNEEQQLKKKDQYHGRRINTETDLNAIHYHSNKEYQGLKLKKMSEYEGIQGPGDYLTAKKIPLTRNCEISHYKSQKGLPCVYGQSTYVECLNSSDYRTNKMTPFSQLNRKTPYQNSKTKPKLELRWKKASVFDQRDKNYPQRIYKSRISEAVHMSYHDRGY